MDIFDTIGIDFFGRDLNFVIGNARFLRRTVAVVKEPKMKVFQGAGKAQRTKKVKKESPQMSLDSAMDLLARTDPQRLLRILTGKETLKNG